jgi:Collagenase and related proteases
MVSNGKIELLAPAGDYDALRAAVENGADAVYLGGKLFNARQLAGNFDLQQLKDALAYAHIRGVNIYLTMNTLISDEEMDKAVEYAKEAWLSGIDGIIVQDIGFAGALHMAIPKIPLHASTQMTVHNLEGARILESLGFKRVVLARELSLTEIKDIAEGTTLEVEVFIHGALCISYSGQCLMSSIIGGRSGNRGKCAQPCRLPYKLIDGKGEFIGDKSKNERYILSPKDLYTLEELESIVNSGVRSLKIEGRMKGPEYVATVVGTYRKHLDFIEGKIENKISPTLKSVKSAEVSHDLKRLEQVFNRGGFTTGYFGGKRGREMMCYEKPKNWGTYLGEVLGFDSARGIVRARLEGDVSIGDGIEVWNGEDESPGTIVTIILAGGKSAKSVDGPSNVEIGNIRGKVFKGCKIYKTSDKRLMAEARESFEGRHNRTINVKALARLKESMPLALKVIDDLGNEVTAESVLLPEKALNRPVTYERLSEQLKKTGATVFEISDLKIEMDEGLSIPVGEINDVRRRALEELEQKRLRNWQGIRNRDETEVMPKEADNKSSMEGIYKTGNEKLSGSEAPKIALYFYGCSLDMDFIELGADRVYIPLKALIKPAGLEFIKACKNNGVEVFVWLPVILRRNYLKLFKDKLSELGGIGVDGLLAGNPGVVQMIKQDSHNIRLMGDYSLNTYNSLSVKEYLNMGFEGITLSPELTLTQMFDILKSASGQMECIVYGRLPLMNSEYCPVGCIKGGFASGTACKGSCRDESYYLKDRLGIDFPVICDNIDCRSLILNSSILFVPDAVNKLGKAGAGILRFYVWDETSEFMKELIELHRQLALDGNNVKYENFVQKVKAGGFTKGHFYRGV